MILFWLVGLIGALLILANRRAQQRERSGIRRRERADFEAWLIRARQRVP
jgi:hypothetical protein